jgi:hypothetical protein
LVSGKDKQDLQILCKTNQEEERRQKLIKLEMRKVNIIIDAIELQRIIRKYLENFYSC